jgi:N-hydroxyarylamine O-acetyltransferase
MVSLDLDAYLRRIGYSGPREPTAPVLEALHLAHATHIPFENLDILLGRPVLLDLASLQEKLVAGARGGYCYEQNFLLAAALERLGFEVTRLAARVRYRTERILPRLHMLLLARADGSSWIADAGFGLEGLLAPVRFDPGRESRQFAWTYRVVEEAGEWVLQSLRGRSWIPLYSFTLAPQAAADYEPANHYSSTHPDSRFTQTLVVQLPSPGARLALRNLELTTDRGDSVTTRMLAGDDELLSVLAGTFGLRFAPGTRFRYRATMPP